jgi:hypothetical protein
MKILRVATFEFLCPQYIEVRTRRGNIAVDREKLGDDRSQAEVDKERRAIHTGDFQDQVNQEAERAQFEIGKVQETERRRVSEEGITQALGDELKAEAQDRRLERKTKALQHQRDHRAADQRLEIELEVEQKRQLQNLQMEKAERALKIANDWKDAEMRRRLEFLQKHAQLPPESILTTALVDNPQLTQSYMALMNAKAREDQAALQQQFHNQLMQAYGHEGNKVHDLVLEALKQLGTYMAKRAEATRATVVPGSQSALVVQHVSPPVASETDPGKAT